MKYHPKKLSFYQMWELYKLLKKDTTEQFLLDEIISMLQTVESAKIKIALEMMYKSISTNPLEVALMFTDGLKSNNFFEFQEFMRSVHGN